MSKRTTSAGTWSPSLAPGWAILALLVLTCVLVSGTAQAASTKQTIRAAIDLTNPNEPTGGSVHIQLCSVIAAACELNLGVLHDCGTISPPLGRVARTSCTPLFVPLSYHWEATSFLTLVPFTVLGSGFAGIPDETTCYLATCFKVGTGKF
jgi:hypothetical protein